MKYLFLSWLLVSTTWAKLPEANLEVSPLMGTLQQTITLNAGLSVNGDQNRSGLRYRFKPTQTSSWTTFSGQNKYFFKPGKTGSFKALLQVKDKNGQVSTAVQTYQVRKTLSRSVKIFASPKNPKAGELVQFQISIQQGSFEDISQVKWRWDFDSDGTFDTPFGQEKTPQYSFSDGFFTPSVQVQFADKTMFLFRGLTVGGELKTGSRYAIKVQPKFGIIESVKITPYKTGLSDSSFMAKLKVSSQIKPVSITWLVNNTVVQSGGYNFRHAFKVKGEQNISVKVCLKNTTCETAVRSINIMPKIIKPTGVIRVYNQTRAQSFQAGYPYLKVTKGDTVRFQFQFNSQKSPGSETRYQWDFDGNGTWDTGELTTSSAAYQYSNSGTFKPRLLVRVSSAYQNSVDAEFTAQMVVRNNQPPQAVIQVEETLIYPYQKVRFKALVFDVNDLQKDLKVRWDFDGDGLWDTDFNTRSTESWLYSKPQDFVVRLEVMDYAGATYLVRKKVKVELLPVVKAAVKVNYRFGGLNTLFKFDATESQGVDVQYRWRIYGDPQSTVYQSSRFTKRFQLLGEKTIELTIIDSSGNTDVVRFPVTVGR